MIKERQQYEFSIEDMYYITHSTGFPSPLTMFKYQIDDQCTYASATFTWESPENRNTNIEEYMLTVNGSDVLVPPNQTSHTIPLNHRASYSAMLSASNCVGKSAAVHLNINVGKKIS